MTVEDVITEFRIWAERRTGEPGVNQATLLLCVDALDDIVAGRWQSNWITAKELISQTISSSVDISSRGGDAIRQEVKA